MTASRLRTISLLAVLVLAALIGLAWSQQWFVLRVRDADLPVPGSVAGGALLPLALASAALVAALAIAGPVFRVLLGALQAVLGATVVAVSVVALVDPAGASSSAITASTGITGRDAVHALVTGVATSAWPVVATVLGVLLALVGLGIAVTARAWPRSGDRYSRTRTAATGDDPALDHVADWDAMSDGDDPTSR